MPVAIISGIIGGIWAIVAGIWILAVAFSPPGTKGSGALSATLVFVIIMGMLSLTAAVIRTSHPRVASSILLLSLAGLFLAALIDPGWLMMFILPAAIFLLPAAVKMSRVSQSR